MNAFLIIEIFASEQLSFSGNNSRFHGSIFIIFFCYFTFLSISKSPLSEVFKEYRRIIKSALIFNKTQRIRVDLNGSVAVANTFEKNI